MRLALYEPDIPQNVGAILRLATCMGVIVEIIEPCGFIWSDQRLKRVGMDYMNWAKILRHKSWDHFQTKCSARLVLLTAKAITTHLNFVFESDAILLCGSESSGAPEFVHEAADAQVRVPIVNEARSLNITVAAAIVLCEALRQTNQFPNDRSR